MGCAQTTSGDVIRLVAMGLAASRRRGFRAVGVQLGLHAYCLLAESQAANRADGPKIATIFGLPVTMEIDPSCSQVVRVVVAAPVPA